MTVLEYSPISAWARRRRINRMLKKTCRIRKGVVMPDMSWRVYAMTASLVLANMVLFVRLWL